jgi:putative ribosome biogenesis GTPase RsgA
MEPKKCIMKILDELYNITDEEIDGIILGQKIEDEEDKLKILKELVGYRSFEDYVNGHEKEFEKVDISDDFKMIFISESIYPEIDLSILKKMGIIVDHFGLTVYILKKEEDLKEKKEEDLKEKKEEDRTGDRTKEEI